MFDKIQNGDNDMSNESASIGKNTDYSNEINGTGVGVAEHFFLNDSSSTSAPHEDFKKNGFHATIQNCKIICIVV